VRAFLKAGAAALSHHSNKLTEELSRKYRYDHIGFLGRISDRTGGITRRIAFFFAGVVVNAACCGGKGVATAWRVARTSGTSSYASGFQHGGGRPRQHSRLSRLVASTPQYHAILPVIVNVNAMAE